MYNFCHHVEQMFRFHGPIAYHNHVCLLGQFFTVWRISVSIGFNTPASLIAFIESSLTKKFDIKIKAHVLRSVKLLYV